MKNVVVAIDSMKGCLTSIEAGNAFAEGLKETYPGIDVKVLHVADGGEGTADCIAGYSPVYQRQKSIVTGPEGAPVEAEWHYDPTTGTACIDMAAAAGLPLIAPAKRNPMRTTTYGVGQLLQEARLKGAKRIILGLGGSATVDGGLGALQALGAVILDRAGNRMSAPFAGWMLTEIGDIDTSEVSADWQHIELTLACDVTTRFTGDEGAAHVFAPQKGANEEETAILDSGLLNLKGIIMEKTGIDLDMMDGSGAAGGCGGGLAGLLGARVTSGADLVLDAVGFDSATEDADLVVTGEGKADRQTLMNKLPGVILRRCLKKGVPTIIVAGKIEDEEKLADAGFARIIDINSTDVIRHSGTEDCDPMDSEVAYRRLIASGKSICFINKC